MWGSGEGGVTARSEYNNFFFIMKEIASFIFEIPMWYNFIKF